MLLRNVSNMEKMFYKGYYIDALNLELARAIIQLLKTFIIVLTFLKIG